jgi:hypothetical protein
MAPKITAFFLDKSEQLVKAKYDQKLNARIFSDFNVICATKK